MKISTISGMGTVALCVGFLTVLAACASGGTTAEQRARQVDETARRVAAAIEGRRLWVDVDYMFPARTAPRSVSGSYGIAVSGDTLRSWLPYIGRAYQLPYGGGKGLAFSALISQYDVRQQKGGDTRVTIKIRNDEDDFVYTLQIYTNGRVDLTVVMRERERISYSGRLDLDKEVRP